MTAAVRSFEFPDREGHRVSFGAALGIVRSALDDEGQALAARGTRLRIAWSVRQPDALLVFVPLAAIVSRDWPRR